MLLVVYSSFIEKKNMDIFLNLAKYAIELTLETRLALGI